MLELVFGVLFSMVLLNIVLDILSSIKYNLKKEKEGVVLSDIEVKLLINGIRRSVGTAFIVGLLAIYFLLKHFL